MFSSFLPSDSQIASYSADTIHQPSSGNIRQRSQENKVRISDKGTVIFQLLMNLFQSLSVDPSFRAELMAKRLVSRLLSSKFYLGTSDPENSLKCRIHFFFDSFYEMTDPEGIAQSKEIMDFLAVSFRHVSEEQNLKASNSLVKAVFRSMSRYKDNPSF